MSMNIGIQFFGGRGSGGGGSARGGGGGNFSVSKDGKRIEINGDTINMSKKGSYQGKLSEERTLSADGKTSTTTETRLYKSNSGNMYEVTEKTVIRERSSAEAQVTRATNPIRYSSGGSVMGTSSLNDMYQTTSTITKVKKRK